MKNLLSLLTIVIYLALVSCQSITWSACLSDQVDKGCPKGWIASDYKCYLFRQDLRLDQPTATIDCQKYGALLLRIDTIEEHQFVKGVLENISVDKSLTWYTSGVMDAANFGEFVWENHIPKFKNFKTELSQIWIDTPPNRNKQPTWPKDRIRVTYAYDNVKWGWQITNGAEKRGYICQAEKDSFDELLPTSRSLDFGQNEMSNVLRGPCLVKEPENAWYIRLGDARSDSESNINKFARFECRAYANPEPKYRWYQINYTAPTNLNPITKIQRTLIDPKKPEFSRYAIFGGNLVIHDPVSTQDSSYFQCEPYNTFGSVTSKTVNIIFGHLESFQKQPRTNTYALAYTSITIPCQPPSHSPSDSLNYIFNMKTDYGIDPVRPEFRPGLFISQANGLLGFSEITSKDSGVYICMITMQNGDEVLASSLKSEDIPVIVRESNEPVREVRIQDKFPAIWPSKPIRGKRARIECFATGDIRRGPLYYFWRRLDGKLIKKELIIDFGRVISFESVQPEDQGLYECSVMDTNGRKAVPKVVNLIINANPYFIVKVTDEIVDVGTSITLYCKSSGIPEPITIWYRNDIKVTDLISLGKLDTARYTLVNTSISETSIKIANLKIEDSAMFTCMATNNLGSSSSSGQLKVVEIAPSFVKNPVIPSMATIGQSTILRCQPEGAPKPTITWSLNGTVLSPGQATLDFNTGKASCSGKQCFLTNGNLLITNLAISDSGTYKCLAENSIGKAESSAILTVIPEINFYMQPRNRLVQANTTVLIPCRASAEEKLDMNYAWYFEGVPIKFDRLDLDARRYDVTKFFRDWGPYFGTLRITNIQFENEGTYSCEVQTSLGNYRKSGIIRVVGPPGPCAGVIVKADENVQKVEVIWTAGANHLSEILYYTIEGKASDDIWRVLVSKLPEKDAEKILTSNGEDRGRRRTVIPDMGANIAYQIRVYAANSYGIGQPSPPSRFITTAPKAPTVAPRNVTGGGGKEGTLVVRWEPLLKKDENALGFFYRLAVRAKGDIEFAEFDLDPNNLNTIDNGKYLVYTQLIGQNKYYKPYEVKIQAINSMGEGPFSDVSQIMSAAKVPTNAPRKIGAGAFNSTSISVWWERALTSEGEGPILGYRLAYYPRIDTHCRTAVSDKIRYEHGQRNTLYGDITSGNIIGIKPDTYYCIGVNVFNSAGDGPETDFIEQTTFKKPPMEFPTIVTVNQTDIPRTLRIHWVGIRSFADEESIDGYTIRYWPAGADFKKTYIDVDVGLKTEGLLRNLNMTMRYYLRVFGYSRGGVGTMSSPIVQFQIIPSEICVPGASWDGPDIRYQFICGSLNNCISYFVLFANFLTIYFYVAT